ncbi:MAG: prephenate dehydrogenase [bacterium]
MEEGSFQSVCIVGVGLIGGSLALALKKANLASRIIGLGRRKESLEKALERGAIDEATLSPEDAFSQADLIVLATPPASIPSFFPIISRCAKKGCLVTDVASVKRRIVSSASNLPPSIEFIGGHPLAGMEKKGVEWAEAELFKNSIYVLTPSPRSTKEGIGKLLGMVEAIGAKPLIMDAETHDLLLAYTSHFPHILAYALSLLFKKLRERREISRFLVAGGFKSMTRIAKSPPDMWEEIFLENKDNLFLVWEEWEKIMEEMRECLEEGRLREVLEEAKKEREKIDEAYM